jgi:hypothetical protein
VHSAVPATESYAVPAAITVSATESIAATISIAAAEPGTGSDEEAAGEPCRTVVSVRSAGVGVIAVVAVGADWRGIRRIVIGVVSGVGLRTGIDLGLRIPLGLLRITLAVIVSRSTVIRSALVGLRAAVRLAAVYLVLRRKRRRRDSDGENGNQQ